MVTNSHRLACTHTPSVRDCGELLDPANGTVSLTGSTVVGSEADYSCLEGFSLSGDALRTCLTSGVWSGQEPQCISEC